MFKSVSLDVEVRLREALVQGEEFGYPCRTATSVAFELLKGFFDQVASCVLPSALCSWCHMPMLRPWQIEKSEDGAFHQLYEILFDSVFPGLMRNGSCVRLCQTIPAE